MRRIAYFISAPGYLPYLVTSINSLRRNFFGDVVIFAWPESYELASRIAEDPAIAARVYKITPWRLHNGYLNQKIDIVKDLSGTTVFLDADTLITGDMGPLLNLAASCAYTGTQFSDWTTKKGIIRKRLERLRPYLGHRVHALDMLLNEERPSLNCGVYGTTQSKKAAQIRNYWLELSLAAESIFIPDECAQHICSVLFADDFVIWQGGGYNNSPLYPSKSNENEQCVWHGHGNMFARPDKSKAATEMWLAEYERSKNIAVMSSWVHEVGNRRISEFLRSQND